MNSKDLLRKMLIDCFGSHEVKEARVVNGIIGSINSRNKGVNDVCLFDRILRTLVKDSIRNYHPELSIIYYHEDFQEFLRLKAKELMDRRRRK